MRTVFSVLCPLLLSMGLLSGCSVLSSDDRAKGGVTYVIRSGDTLSELEDRFRLPQGELRRVNSIQDPRSLQIGQVLLIPAVGPLTNDLPAHHFLSHNDAEDLKKIKLDGVRHYVRALRLPVNVPRLTSHFGWRGGRFHEGLDLAVPEGTKIFAAHDGEVVFESRSFGGYGRIVVLKGENLLTVYAHNKRNRVDVGDTVRRGEWIADVGQTGAATGPHLHFETRVRNEKGRYAAVNPILFYSPGRSS